MRKLVKTLVIITAGFTMGVISTKKYYETRYKNLADEEIESVKETYSSRIRKVRKELEEIRSSQQCDGDTCEQGHNWRRPNRYPNTKAAVDQTKSYHKDEVEEVDEDDNDEDEEEDTPCCPYGPEDDLPTEPYIISCEQFSDENPHYDKITLTYYSYDDVLINDNEEIIDDVEATIGYDALYSFGEGSEGNVVYVRNDRVSTDYEVIRSKGSYSRDVLGVEE